jgi:6-phosphogluconate dehydrogenase (decarboxylating)
LKERAVHYVDVGTSGGVWGLERGFRSRRDRTFAEKILFAMRKGFGAHVEPKNRKAKPS